MFGADNSLASILRGVKQHKNKSRQALLTGTPKDGAAFISRSEIDTQGEREGSKRLPCEKEEEARR